MLGYIKRNRLSRFMAALALGLVVFSSAGVPASAGIAELSPKTKIHISIIQWMPTKGAYEKWDALGGEFTISPNATLTSDAALSAMLTSSRLCLACFSGLSS